jgi:isocitrate lyase
MSGTQVPTVLIARTDADSATLLTSDVDEVDRQFCTGERTPEGFFKVKCGVEVSPNNCIWLLPQGFSNVTVTTTTLHPSSSGALQLSARGIGWCSTRQSPSWRSLLAVWPSSSPAA